MSARAPTESQLPGNRAPCPRCRSNVDAVRNADNEFNCRICGGPVVVTTDARVPRSGREIPTLERVRRNRTQSKLYRAGSLILGGASGVAAFFLAGLLWLIHPALFVTLMLSVAMTAPFVLALLAWRHATALTSAAHADYRQALQDVAEDVVRSSQTPVSSAELSRILATTEAQTDALLARLNTLDTVESQVTDDGELVFVTRPEGRLRVAPDAFEAELEDAVHVPAAQARQRQR